MKISLIIGSFYPADSYGGPIYSTLHLSQELARSGICINVVTTNANNQKKLDVETNRFIKLEKNLFVKYYGWASKKSFSLPLLLNMWRDIRKTDVVLIQPVFSSYVPAALFYAKLLKKPVLLSPRGSLRDWCLQSGSRLKKLWLKVFVEPMAGRINWHATSQQEANEIKLLYKDANVYCIPNGINPNEFENINILSNIEYMKKYTNLELECNQIVISMGRLHKVKGFDILLDAFKLIKERLPGAVLLIAGQDSGERNKLLNQIEELHLEDSVFLVGQIRGQDKIDFLSNADVFALPSHNESFGVVYAEALAAGTPIVASKNTPWSEVEKYKCGYWVENSPEEVSQAIIHILNSDYKGLGLNGKKYIHDNFDWINIAKEFKTTFELLSYTNGNNSISNIVNNNLIK